VIARRWPILLLVATSLAADAPGPAKGPAAGGYAIRWNLDEGSARATVDVVGIDPANLAALAATGWDASRWAAMLSVSVAAPDAPAIPGTYRVVGDVVRFEPRFPIHPGLEHRARFRPSQLPKPPGRDAPDVVAAFTRPAPATTPTTTVVQVYPTAGRVPENLLKLYLHFSSPMSRGEVYDRVRLLDASGRAVDHPFLEIGEELWDPSGTRITLLFQPGRIKRGLRPREEDGPILEAGKSYTLVVDAAWPDADGRPLRAPYRRSFRAGPPDDVQPDPKSWTIVPPAAGTRDPLSITFPEPLDHAMLGRALAVRDPDERPIPGEITIEAGETRWRFRPDRPWPAGMSRLVVDTSLEDLAGNSVARPFEVDVQRPIGRRVEAEFMTVPIAIR
jgi:hypothetical protein